MRRLTLASLCLLLLPTRGTPAPAVPPSVPASNTYHVIKDIDYQSIEPSARGDLYLPERTTVEWTAPAVIWMHGNHHDKADSRERHIGADLASTGYVCFSINY